jgi:hypothetical protein
VTIRTQADVERIMVERNVSFVFDPLISQQPDGAWLARYPGADWSVTADNADEARAQLRVEELRRMSDPEASSWKINAVRLHVEHGPVDGVYELDNTAADRAIQAGTPAALDAEIAAIKHRPEHS